MPQTVADALKNARIISDENLYRFVRLPKNGFIAAAGVAAEVGDPFIALLVDAHEITLMLDDDAYTEYGKRLLDHNASETLYRLITFDVALEPTLVGFMAHVSQALAAEGISILPFAAYTRDHLFVAQAQFDAAMQALKAIQAEA